jgi:hypothetical protein
LFYGARCRHACTRTDECPQAMAALNPSFLAQFSQRLANGVTAEACNADQFRVGWKFIARGKCALAQLVFQPATKRDKRLTGGERLAGNRVHGSFVRHNAQYRVHRTSFNGASNRGIARSIFKTLRT